MAPLPPPDRPRRRYGGRRVRTAFVAALALSALACGSPGLSIEATVRAQLARYPLAELADLHMALYHGAIGPAHGTLDSAAASRWLEGEIASLPAGPLEPLAEDLAGDTSVVRLNLRAFLALGGAPDSLLAAFVRSGRSIEPRPARLDAALAQLVALAERGSLPWSADSVRRFVARLTDAEHATLAHSPAYLEEYRPAYRVLSRTELLRLMPDSLHDRLFTEPRPPFPTGRFVDDYGSVHRISAEEWRQDAYVQMRIRGVNPARRYLIGSAIPADSSAAARWSRVDWISLDGAPWSWAYCIIAYDRPSAALSEADTSARPETPRTGCNGFPFTRMRAADPLAP